MQDNFPLVSTDWLSQYFNKQELVILDASVQDSSEHVYIKNAQRFDFKNVFCDTSSDLPGMMPSVEKFNHEAKKLSINDDSLIIVYDNKGIFSSPRAWWMFNAMGHSKVYVLDGGLPKWINENHPTSKTIAIRDTVGNFQGQLESSYIKDSVEILDLHLNDKVQIIDARSTGRFMGIEPEPREGLRLGHIPQSINIPFTSLLKDGQYLEQSKLKTIFKDAKVDSSKQQIFTCGSGVTACVVLLASQIAGYHSMQLYDGSWTEWGADVNYPISYTNKPF